MPRGVEEYIVPPHHSMWVFFIDQHRECRAVSGIKSPREQLLHPAQPAQNQLPWRVGERHCWPHMDDAIQ
jgi:hypothetical protein